MKKYVVLIFLSLIVFFGCSQTEKKKDARFSGIEIEIDSLIQEHNAAGLAVAVVEKGETIYKNGFGYRDFENKKPVDENTVFGIGSCSKAFTASVMGLLEKDGKLSLQDKPSEHLVDFKFNTAEMNDSIRLHHLLTHTTGLGPTASECVGVLFITPDKYDVLPKIQYLKPSSSVGREFSYNNLMYALAGMVTEKASENSLEENWQNMIFDPLDMKNTYVDIRFAESNPNFSFAYAVNEDIPERVLPEDMSVRGAGGAIFSSVSDMSKWMEVWLSEGQFKGKEILPEDYVSAAQDEHIPLPFHPRDTIRIPRFYGYGWFNWNHKGFPRSEHSGGASGYVSNLVLYPEEEVGIVVLSNQTTTSLPSMVTNRIVERLYPQLKERPLEMNTGQAFTIDPIDTPSIPDTILPPSFALSETIGKYVHPGFGEIEVTLKGQTLYAKFPMTTFRLAYVGNGIFYDYFTEQIPHTYWNFLEFRFEQDSQGKINGVWINVDIEPVLFQRQMH